MPIWLQTMDEQILLWIQNTVRQGILNPWMVLYTSLGNVGLLWIVCSLWMLLFPKTRRMGIIALTALLLGMLCTNVVLKHWILRPRPYVTMGELLVPLVTSGDPNSFPSGHTCAAFAAGVVWMKLAPGWGWKFLALVQGVVMGLSRLYVGVHYPSDVLAGALVGSLCGLAALWIWSRGRKRE